MVAGAIAGALLALALVGVLFFALATYTGVARLSGRETGLALDAPVSIARDARGVAHVRARTDHDLFFAEGYAMASDRLFQMDLTRRFTEGRLAELLGPPVLKADRAKRSYGIERLAANGFARAGAGERALLVAFAAGVNAAAQREPLPPEYRVLFARFRPWRPQDSIEVGYATLLDLDDEASSIIARDQIRRRFGSAGTDFFLPLTDPRYDVPTNGDPVGAIAKLPALPRALQRQVRRAGAQHRLVVDERTTLGSNGWVVGAARTTVHRAILANDPHLSLGVPSVWWLFEGRSPGFHIAGAVLAGTLGVTLGHNDHVAWGVTAGETSAMRLIREPMRGDDEFFEHGRWIHASHRLETLDVRFAAAQHLDILRTPNGTLIGRDGDAAYLRDWDAERMNEDLFAPYLGLDRSGDAKGALGAMRDSPEPALNLLVVDDRGRAAYHLMGAIPNDGVWGRWALDGNAPRVPAVPYARLPHVDPSRSALVVSANNRAAGRGSLRLAPFWPSPYRAYEIRRALATARSLTPAAIAAPQTDEASPAEKELAQLVVAACDREHAGADPALAPAIADLRRFDGSFVPQSQAATIVAALRGELYRGLTASLSPEVAASYTASSTTLTFALRALRERPAGWVPHWDAFVVGALRATLADVATPVPAFGVWGIQPLDHPLSAFGLRWWNGPSLTGRGGAYAPAVQNHGHGQSFRAEWIAGDWDASTIDIDAGESGEPGSAHYRDQSAGWQRFARTTLPFSDAAVRAATHSTLILAP